MQNRSSRLRTLTLVMPSLVLGALGGIILDHSAPRVLAQQPTPTATAATDVQLISEAWDVINRSYVDRSAVQSRALTYAAIRAMADALGDLGHTRFLTPDAVKRRKNSMNGFSEGTGASIEIRGGLVVILACPDGSPAQQAGLKPGDIVLAVDGVRVAGLTAAQVSAKLLGPAGTSVRLTIRDPMTGMSRELAIVRARVTLHNVTWAIIPGTSIADIHIAHFSRGVTQDLQDAWGGAQARGATAIILDLRDDPGGNLDEAVGVSSQFLSTGNVLEEEDAHGAITEIPVKPGGVATAIPLILLINHGTASASEIVASALQDAHRAQLVGTTTFGTGTVLHQFAFSDGSALLLATREWLTPAGRSFWHTGIVPDVPIAQPGSARTVFPDVVAHMTPADLPASNDLEFFKAMELLGQPLPASP